MKYVVGVIGFIFVFIAVYLITTFGLVVWLPLFIKNPVPLFVAQMNNPIGIIFGLLAGISSFRASIKIKGKPKRNQSKIK